MADAIERVGLGVDLLDGANTITELRAIREEMTLITRLAGRGPGGPGGPGGTARAEETIRNVENLEIASIRRVERERVESVRRSTRATGPITEAEINQAVTAERRKLQFREEVARRVKAIRDKELADERAVQEERERIYAQGQARVAYFNSRLSQRDTRSQQARIAAQAERDEENAPLKARLAQGRKDNVNRIINERAAEQERQRLAQQHLSNYQREIDEQFSLIKRDIRNEQFRIAERRKLREQERLQPFEDLKAGLSRSQEDIYGTLYSRRAPSSPEAPIIVRGGGGQGTLQNLNTKAAIAQVGATVGGQKGSFKMVGKNLTFIPAEAPPSPPSTPPDGGTGGEGGGDDASGPSRAQKGLSAVGRIFRNFLIYEAITKLTFGLKEYTQESLEAAKATIEQGNALKYATEAAGGNLEQNRALSRQLQQYGYNAAQAPAVVAQAARATYRHPEQTAALAQLATDIAASRGGGLQNATRVIEDIQEGRDRTYREYFNVTPEDLYKQEARKAIAQRTDASQLRIIQGTEPRDYKTEKQEIAAYTATLSEAQKEEIRLRFAVSQTARFQGDAASRALTFAGRMDQVSAAFYNTQVNVGTFITSLGPLNRLLTYMASLGSNPTSVFSLPELAQSGLRNTVSEGDILKYGRDNTDIGRAGNSLSSILGLNSRYRNLSRIEHTLDFAANNITPLNSIKNLMDRVLGQYQASIGNEDWTTSMSERQLAEYGAQNQARAIQVRQLNQLRAEGQLKYRDLRQGGLLGRYTYAELRAQGFSGGDVVRNFREEPIPQQSEAEKTQSEYQDQRRALIARAAFGNAAAKAQLDKLEAQQTNEFISGFKPTDYDAQALRREDERRQKEREEKYKDLQERQQALTKLRETAAGSFRLVGDIGEALTGKDNQFTKILADQITAGERMTQQWGFLGKAAVDYFTTLEQKGLARQLNQAEYGAFTKSSDLILQAGREADARNDPTALSRREQEYLNIQSAIVNKATQIPILWRQAAEVLRGPTLSGREFLGGSLSAIARAFGVRGPRLENALGQDITPNGTRYNALGQPIGGIGDFTGPTNALGQSLEDPAAMEAFRRIGIGQSPQVRRQLRSQFASSILGSFQGMSAAQIRNSGFSSYYLAAIRAQSAGLDDNISEQLTKTQLGASEDARLANQLRADDEFRRKQLAAGRDAGDVGRESDKLILARTQGLSQKDLTLDQFQARQEALRREADRTVKDQEEAKEAVKKGLAYQGQLLAEVQALRSAIIGGNASVLIQVQNDTQARVDKDALQEAEPGVTKLLTLGSPSSNPYTPSTDKYRRVGGAYGLTNK